jgi:hypothetical protein
MTSLEAKNDNDFPHVHCYDWIGDPHVASAAEKNELHSCRRRRVD